MLRLLQKMMHRKEDSGERVDFGQIPYIAQHVFSFLDGVCSFLILTIIRVNMKQ